VHAAVLLVCAASAASQEEDLTLPPRLDDATNPQTAPENNRGARATPPEQLEEIVVTSDPNPWRLPDLGSSWRARQAEQSDAGRIRAELLPLWNPEVEEPPTRNPFAVTDDSARVGFIEVFRVRFGRR
jgi:hypothetical protein